MSSLEAQRAKIHRIDECDEIRVEYILPHARRRTEPVDGRADGRDPGGRTQYVDCFGHEADITEICE